LLFERWPLLVWKVWFQVIMLIFFVALDDCSTWDVKDTAEDRVLLEARDNFVFSSKSTSNEGAITSF
jgi:hypothetical protein